MSKPIAGVLPIVHTPFDDEDRIDASALADEIDWAFRCGADGYATGMVSELLRLTYDERRFLTERLAELNQGRGVFVASVGAESTKQAVEFATHAERSGADAVMAIPPTTTALGNEQTAAYFRAIADSISLPVIVQDASAYVGRSISLSVYGELLDEYGSERILFKPEASPIGPNLSALRELSGGAARVLEGSGGILLVDSFRRGITGTMPGMELLDGIVAIWRALQNGDDDTAYRVYFPICAIVALQMQAGLDGFLAIEKYVLRKRGVFRNEHRRSPNAWSLDQETAAEVDRLLGRMQQALAE
ncbi:MAG: dihydrodipicolinate synthase family protein [Planctomycetales bacterium]|nr:dihydrodipicolinate synthase family protein [Planctomycetales bacterium]